MRKLLLRGQSEHLRLPPSKKKSHLRGAFPNVLFDLFPGDAYLVTILMWSYTSAMIHWKFKYYIFIHTTETNFCMLCSICLLITLWEIDFSRIHAKTP